MTTLSSDKLSTLLLLSSFVSAAMMLVLVVARQSLPSGSSGTGAWVFGDLANAVARALLVGSFSPQFLAAWEAHVGVWEQHQIPASLRLVGFWCHLVALRRLAGFKVPSAKANALACAAMFAIAMVVMADIPSVAVRKAVAIFFVVVVYGALTVRTAWSLAHRFWGARMLAFGTGLPAAWVGARLLGAAFGGGLASLGEMTQEKEFVGEIVYSLWGTMAFILIQQERLRERILQMSVTDGLTGAFNRNGLLPLLKRELRASHRSGLPLSVVLFDLDHFKRINDSHGHAAGDAVLRDFAALVRDSIRPRDALCRWGGEEFLLMLPELNGDAATRTARRIVRKLRDNPIEVAAGERLAVTVSAGVAMLEDARDLPERMEALLEPLIAKADRGLYQAKERRNCVVSHRAEFAPTMAPDEAACAD